MNSNGITGRVSRLPGLSGSVRIQLLDSQGRDLTGPGHRHSVITAEDNTWTHGIHLYSYDNPKVHSRLYEIANSVVPEVIMVTWSGSVKIKSETVWITSVHELPKRAQGSRELRVETVDLLWSMNRYHRTRPQKGAITEILSKIAAAYGMKSACMSASAVAYVQSNETDYEFLTRRLRKRALTPPPEHGDFRLNVRYSSTGAPVLCFAPLRSTDREFNWWAVNISDPNIIMHGDIEFVNQTPIRMAHGAAGVRTLVVDPYSTEYRDQYSFAAHAETATPESVLYSTQNEQNVSLSGKDTSGIRHYHTVTDTLQEDGPQGALALAVSTAECARMGNYEAVFTISSQPWFTPTDRVTLRAATPSASELDWFVTKCVTTISEGACTTHVVMITDEPQAALKGIQIQSIRTHLSHLRRRRSLPRLPLNQEGCHHYLRPRRSQSHRQTLRQRQKRQDCRRHSI